MTEEVRNIPFSPFEEGLDACKKCFHFVIENSTTLLYNYLDGETTETSSANEPSFMWSTFSLFAYLTMVVGSATVGVMWMRRKKAKKRHLPMRKPKKRTITTPLFSCDESE